MRTIAQLSDLHFGRVNVELLAPLRKALEALRPDLVVVSGDLTQRAKTREFEEARAYLDTLPKPQLVVPGNHDVPLYNVFMRFLQPYARYQRLFSQDLEPHHIDGEIAVVGVNTARSLVFKGGRINEEQVARAQSLLCPLGVEVIKILVTHHPFDVPEDSREDDQIVGRAKMALETLAGCGADVLLSGHLHATHVGHTADRYRIAGLSALVVQAGTALSTRGRGESNSFNVLLVAPRHIEVQRHAWDGTAYRREASEAFRHSDTGWTKADAGP
ncbi:MAG: metallophosphoesterase family protein [Usitatibacter sp.]